MTLEKIQNLVEIQGWDGNWNYDSYMHGMYNGMELLLSILEDREPVFKKAPPRFICDKEKETGEPISTSDSND
jgi:hypothetical protein